MTAFIGVRMSCDMRERNSLLACVADSAFCAMTLSSSFLRSISPQSSLRRCSSTVKSHQTYTSA